MFEYEDSDAKNLAYAGLRVVSGVWAGMLVAESAMTAMFMYDIFTVHCTQRLESRAHSKIELLALASQTCSVLSHFCIHSRSPVVHFAICAVLSTATALGYLYFLPFYSLFATFVNVLTHSTVAWAACATLLSVLLSNSTSGFILTLLLPFALPPLLWELLQRRQKYIEDTYLRDFVHLRTPYQCELTIRLATFKYSQTARTHSAWRDFYATSHSELFNRMTKMFAESMNPALWEFAFIFGVLKDESLARIKLSKTRNCAFDLEGAFNQYRFMRVLARRTDKVNEEVDYVNFRLLFDQAKKADEESCMFQLDFWTELSAEKPIVKKVETLARKVNGSINRARDLLAHLVQVYPNSHHALRLYGSFLTEVLNDTEKGQELTSRSIFEEQELKGKAMLMENHFSYFDDDSNGIMLISGSQESIGNIVYVNTEAANILSTKSKIVMGMNIASFLPNTIISQQAHDLALQRFLLYSKSNDVGLPFNLFLIDITGYLIEVHIQVKCMSLDLKQFFIVALKRNYAHREVCIFDPELLIKSHTRGFPSHVGYSDSCLLYANMKIDVMVQDFAKLHTTHPSNEVFRYSIPGTVNNMAMKFYDLVFRAQLFHLLYCTQDEDEARRWTNSGETDAAGNFLELMQEDGILPTVQLVETETLARSTSLKPSLRPQNAPKKNLRVMFDLVPVFFELLETDFRPGKGIIGKTKDAAPVDAKASKAISFQKEEVKENEESKPLQGEIFDLKDLADFELEGPKEELPMDQQSKASIAILSELSMKVGGDGRQSGKSVASSAVSSNSSFTSSATAIQLLKVVQSSMTRFKCSFLFTNLVVVCSVLAMMIYLIVASKHYEEVLVIKELSSQRSLCAVMAALARDLMLVYGKVLPPAEEPSYRAQLQSTLDQFNTIVDLLMNRVEGFSRYTPHSSEYRSIYLDRVVPSWEYSAGTVIFVEDNLLNILKKMSAYTTSVLSIPPTEMNYTDPGLFYVYRNGQGETLRLLNSSTWEFITGEQEAFKVTMNIIGGLGILAFLLMLACFMIVMLPTVVQVDRSNQDVWTFFYKLPLDVIQDLKFRREDRIETVHGIEMEQKLSGMSHFKNTSTRTHIKCSRKWPHVFSRIWVYYLLTMAYAVYFYLDVYVNLGQVLLRKPEVLNMIGERDLGLQCAFHWLQETIAMDSPVSYYNILPTSQLEDAPKEKLTAVLDRLRSVEDAIVESDASDIGFDANSTSVTFATVCAGAGDCWGTLGARGVHSGIVGYVQDVLFLSTSQASLYSPELLSLRESTWLLHSQLQSLLTTMQSKLSADIDLVRLRLELLTVSYCVVVILFYVMVYLPMASMVRKQLTDIWDLAGLIPIDLLEKIKRAMRVTDESNNKKKKGK